MNPPLPQKDNRLQANLYRLLATLLARPPADATLMLLLLTGIPAGTQADSDLWQCWRNLRAEAACRTLGQLEEEYNNLFVGLGRGEVVPYGSWYLCGRLMDKPLAHLRGDLASLGIERRPDNPETEDHVAALCETMALISDPDASVSRERRQAFFYHHIVSWMPRFFKDLQAAPSAGFYRAVARIGEAFMAGETVSIS